MRVIHSVDGVPRSYRDRKDIALQSAQILKSRNPNSVVKLKDLKMGKRSSSHSRRRNNNGMALTIRRKALAKQEEVPQIPLTKVQARLAAIVGRAFRSASLPPCHDSIPARTA
jgi:hypothetical protein